MKERDLESLCEVVAKAIRHHNWLVSKGLSKEEAMAEALNDVRDYVTGHMATRKYFYLEPES